MVWLLEIKSLVTLVLPIFYGFLEFALENRSPLCVRSPLTISADSADDTYILPLPTFSPFPAAKITLSQAVVVVFIRYTGRRPQNKMRSSQPTQYLNKFSWAQKSLAQKQVQSHTQKKKEKRNFIKYSIFASAYSFSSSSSSCSCR